MIIAKRNRITMITFLVKLDEYLMPLKFVIHKLHFIREQSCLCEMCDFGAHQAQETGGQETGQKALWEDTANDYTHP